MMMDLKFESFATMEISTMAGTKELKLRISNAEFEQMLLALDDCTVPDEFLEKCDAHKSLQMDFENREWELEKANDKICDLEDTVESQRDEIKDLENQIANNEERIEDLIQQVEELHVDLFEAKSN